ncbi:MAG: InlB B-repeat-containing protein [Clostridia bacterium]|nr:InlB B-repeat-containing protein [Clostridia bacterium]
MKKSVTIIIAAAAIAIVAVVAVVLVLVLGKSKITYDLYTSAEEYSSVEVDAGSEYTLPTPSKEGYEFDGWYASADFSGDAITVAKSDQSASYYAKWSKLYTVTLDLDGGNLSVSSLTVKEGVDLYEYMKSYVPQKSGLSGVWFYDGKELNLGNVVRSDMSLSAKYQVGYTVELREKSGDSYEIISKTNKTGYLGEKVESTERIKGFTEVATSDTANKIESLGVNAATNVIIRYFERETFSITFDSNYGGEVENQRRTIAVKYGENVTVPTDFTSQGRYLAGWSKSRTGEVEYSVNFIDTLIYNKEEGVTYEVEADSFEAETSVTLYAVWTKAYTDMFGGSDYLFLPDPNADKIYISRGDLLFKGKYYPESSEFLFRQDGKTVVRGKLLADGIYAYYDSERGDRSAVLLYVDKEAGIQVNRDSIILFGEYNELTYSTVDEDGSTHRSEGTFIVDGDDYVVNFTSGDMAGKTCYFFIGSVNVNGSDTAVFSIRNQEEYELGKLIRFERENKSFGRVDQNGVYDITIDGYGTAVYQTASGPINLHYYVDKENETIILFDNTNAVAGVLRVYESRMLDGITKGYMFYNDIVDGEYEAPDGATLSLDGVYGATYTKDGASVSGEFTATDSVFGGLIIVFESTVGRETHTFFLEEHEGGEDLPEGEVYYTLSYKANGYAEYYYADENSVYYAPMLVLNDEEDGQAIVYGYIVNDKEYVKVSEGVYEYKDGVYTFTADESKIDAKTKATTSPINIARVKSFVFGEGETANGFKVNYWYSQTTVANVTRNYGVVYNSDDGETLKLVGGFAEYTYDGQTKKGAYSREGDVVSVKSGNGMYFEITGENSFRTLDFEPYTAYSIADLRAVVNEYIENKKGTFGERRTAELDFDGSDGAIYRVVKTTDGKEIVETEISGKISVADKTTESGAPIYRFVSDDLSFEYISLVSSDGSAFFGASDGYGKTYTGESGRLTLDGYGFEAAYRDTDGNEYEGQYIVISDDLILIIADEGEFVFALTGDGFESRGTEYGSYVVVDNWNDNGVYIDFDGKGNARVYGINEETLAEEIIDEEGSYERKDDLIVVTYKQGIKTVTLTGDSAVYNFRVNGENVSGAVFVKVREEVVQTYINEKDWSIIELNSLGGARKTDKFGVVHDGIYVLISEDLLYYEHDEDSLVYSYDSENGTISPISFEPTSYYTEDLDSIVFTEYGFAVFNGRDRYYYNIENNKIYIYKPDLSEENFGFVKEQFGTGKFDAKIENYGESQETYLRSSGYEVLFKREEDTKNMYPVTASDGNKYSLEDLSFSPSGSDNYTVYGKVRINDEFSDCTVIGRRENGELYLTVSVGQYNFEIEASYKGENAMNESLSTYRVVDMSGHAELHSQDYLDYVNMISVYYGTAFARSYSRTLEDEFGIIDIVTAYDVEGNKISESVSGSFTSASGIIDADGKVISFSGAEFEEDNKKWIVTLTADDGNQYKMYFDYVDEYYRNIGYYGFYMTAFVRVQTLTSGSGYSLNVEMTVSTMVAYGLNPGDLYSAKLANGEQSYELWTLLEDEGTIYYVSRTEGSDGKYENTKYFALTLEEAPSGAMSENEVIPLYKEEFELKEISVRTKYTEDGNSYADIITTDEGDVVTFIDFEGSRFAVTTSEYDEEKEEFTISVDLDRYTVKENGDFVIISEIA